MSVADDIDTLLGERLLVRRYQKPEETPGGVIIPESHRDDKTFSIWELVQASEAAEQALGMSLDDDREYLVYTPHWRGTWVGRNRDGGDYFILSADHVDNIEPWGGDDAGD